MLTFESPGGSPLPTEKLDHNIYTHRLRWLLQRTVKPVQYRTIVGSVCDDEHPDGVPWSSRRTLCSIRWDHYRDTPSRAKLHTYQPQKYHHPGATANIHIAGQYFGSSDGHIIWHLE